MINFIIKDLFVFVKSEKMSILKYSAAFIVIYFFLNEISYYMIPVLVTYFIMIGIFSTDYENKTYRFIRSLPMEEDRIVYARYATTIILSILVIIVNNIICNILSVYFFREIVLNDILFSFSIILVISSFALPMFFKYGYEKIKILVGAMGIGTFLVMSSFMRVLSDKIHFIKHTRESIISAPVVSSEGQQLFLFDKIFSGMVEMINVDLLNIFVITAIAGILFLISMKISVNIMNNSRYNR